MSVRHICIIFVALFFLCMTVSCANSKKETERQNEIDTDYQMAVGFYENGKTPEAIRYLTLVLANEPEHAEANALMGIIRLGRGQYNEAVRHFKTALQTKPDMLTCKNNLGAAYLYLEQYEAAATIFKELSASPLYTSPWLAFVNLGWAYYQMGMVQEAIDETEMSVTLNPNLCLGFNNLGIMYHATDRDERALENLTEAIRLCPNYPEPYLHLGVIYNAQNKNHEAYQAFVKCASLTPKSDLGKRCQKNASIVQ